LERQGRTASSSNILAPQGGVQTLHDEIDHSGHSESSDADDRSHAQLVVVAQEGFAQLTQGAVQLAIDGCRFGSLFLHGRVRVSS
jgi:hypothetical protein